jgi:hypothetical protein
MRMVGWLMFIYATFFTLKHYPEKVRCNAINKVVEGDQEKQAFYFLVIFYFWYFCFLDFGLPW